MITININGGDFWNEITEEYLTVKPCSLVLEHSLISVSKWESKWKKSFLSSEKTDDELRDYVRCMTINQNVDPTVYEILTDDDMMVINAYIDDSMTATTFKEDNPDNQVNDGRSVRKKIITSEQVYGWMISLNVPSEYQKWHFNRLLTLIRVLQKTSTSPDKNRKPDLKSRAALNAARRRKMHSKG